MARVVHEGEAETRPDVMLPRFNWGAFLMPPLWGVAHGMWPGLFFVPLWLFAENAIRSSAEYAAWTRALAWGTAALTLGFQVVFAAQANRLVWRRASSHMDAAEYVRRERVWGIVSVGALLAVAGWVALSVSRGR